MPNDDFALARELETERKARKETDDVLFGKHDTLNNEVGTVKTDLVELRSTFTEMAGSVKRMARCMQFGVILALIALSKQFPIITEWAHYIWTVIHG